MISSKTFSLGRRLSALAVLLICFGLGWSGLSAMKRFAEKPFLWERMVAGVQGYEFLDKEHVVFQTAKYDCGPAALAMALHQVAHDVRLNTLESETLDDQKGTTLGRMQDVAIRHGVPLLGARITPDQLASLQLPAIALMKGKHYVVVADREQNQTYIVLDPALGRYRLTGRRLVQDSSGVFLTVVPAYSPTVSQTSTQQQPN